MKPYPVMIQAVENNFLLFPEKHRLCRIEIFHTGPEIEVQNGTIEYTDCTKNLILPDCSSFMVQTSKRWFCEIDLKT